MSKVTCKTFITCCLCGLCGQLLLACSVSPVNVDDYSKHYPSDVKEYAWLGVGELDTADNPVNAIMYSEFVREAVDRFVQARGLILVESESAQVFFRSSASLNNALKIEKKYKKKRPLLYIEDRDVQGFKGDLVMNPDAPYARGSIAFSVEDAKSGKVIWRASLNARLPEGFDEPADVTQMEQVVNILLQDIPFGSHAKTAE